MISRREFLKSIGLTSVVVGSLSIAACSQSQQRPTPFRKGKEVSPPIGCTELRVNDDQGDCE